MFHIIDKYVSSSIDERYDQQDEESGASMAEDNPIHDTDNGRLPADSRHYDGVSSVSRELSTPSSLTIPLLSQPPLTLSMSTKGMV